MVDGLDLVRQLLEPLGPEPEERFGEVPCDREDPGRSLLLPECVRFERLPNPPLALLGVGSAHQAVDLRTRVPEELGEQERP
jgi:hypothetical protein